MGARTESIVTAREAAQEFCVTMSYLRKLAAAGDLRRISVSARCSAFRRADVARVIGEKERLRKKRGGRPRTGGCE